MQVCTGLCHVAVSSGENLCSATIRVTLRDGKSFVFWFLFFKKEFMNPFSSREAGLEFNEEIGNALEFVCFFSLPLLPCVM